MKVNYLFSILFCFVYMNFSTEINQKILDDQSNQNLTNNSDSNTESGIQHLRSSITRTLLMNSGT